MREAEEIKTKRLAIRAWSDDELRAALDWQKSAVSLRIYNSMLAGVLCDPNHRLWHTNWEICLRSNGTTVGEIGFMGPANGCGEVEIACAILHEYRHKGYAREAVAAMTKWAFQNNDVYYIMAEEARDGMAAERALTKLGFRPTDRFGVEGRYYEIERTFVSQLKTMMSLGVSFGLLIGAAIMGNITAGVLIGTAAGYVVGSVLDVKERKKRENLRQMRQ